MRILLATAVAIAPLLVASEAMANVVINTARTTPIRTSTATGTTADNIEIASGGAINVTTGTAVTIDSNHNFLVATGGGVNMGNSADGSTGVLVGPGVTSNVTVSGQIVLTDSINDYPDTDSDGDLDGPWATGTNRFGIRYAAGAPVTGDLLVNSGGVVSVEGNNSYGISIESNLIGKLQSFGSVTITGDNSVAVRTTGNISGAVNLLGNVSATGANSSAVSIGGDVGGRVSLQGSIAASGYRYTTRGSDAFVGKLDADDLLQGGPAVLIAGNVAAGVLIDRAPVDTDPTSNDDDADGIPDASETTGSVTSYGKAAAVQIGSASSSITLGVAGVGDNAYGFINRGSLSGQGVYDGVTATALSIGGNAGQTVTINGGVRNESAISALAFDANATAVHLQAGAQTPMLFNSGTITSGVSSKVAATGTSVLIDVGANVPVFNNSGTILSTAGGATVNTYGVRDLSGTLTSITNTGQVQTNISPINAGDTVTGQRVAIDVSANTTGVTLVQNGTLSTPTSADPDTDGDGVPNSKEPQIYGDIRFGSGADVMDIRNGIVRGDMSFGAGADSLLVSGGADVRGAISDTDGNLAISVSKGVLETTQTNTQTISSLNVGTEGKLVLTVDPQASSNGGLNVTGGATLSAGSQLGVRFNSLLAAPTRFNLITAGSLNAGGVNLGSLQENAPYLYVVEGGINSATNTIYADARQRTTQEAGLISVEASMYDAFYSSLSRDTDMRNAFLAQLSRDDFINLYEQLLPDHSGGPLVSLASGVDAVTRALTGRNASAAPGETSAWVQEINFYADKEKTDSYGFRSEGFGVAGGVERGTGLGAVGLSVAFTSSDLEDPESEAEEVLSANLLELGLYWRAQGQYWTTWARAAAGYATFESERRFVGAGLNLTNTSDWNGLTLSAAGGASYERSFGRFSIRPEVYAEYFSLSEDGHVESGGGDGFDLEIDDRDGHLFSATAAINVAMSMGQNSWLKPELRLGWRQNISVDPGETIARFRSGGPDFRLSPDTIEGGGPIVGFRLNVGNELGMLSVSADAEMLDNYVRYMLFLRASFRF